MFRAVWPTESGNRSLIGVVLGQQGDNLITAGLDAAKQLVDRLAPNAAPPETFSMSGTAGRLARANRGSRHRHAPRHRWPRSVALTPNLGISPDAGAGRDGDDRSHERMQPK